MTNKTLAFVIFTFILLMTLLFLSQNFNTLFSIQEEYQFNQTVKEFSPVLEFKIENESLKKAEPTLISYKSVSCPENYPIYCRGICYQKCEIGYLECYENKTGKCIYYQPNVSYLYDKLVKAFVNYVCEDKIDPESLKSFTISLLPNYGASAFPYLLYNFNIYKWIKENIRYLPGSYSEAMLPTKTLELKAGKCDDQAILFASMSASIGSVVRIRYVEGCQQATSYSFLVLKKTFQTFSNEKEFQYFEAEDGIWIPFDTTYKVGKLLMIV